MLKGIVQRSLSGVQKDKGRMLVVKSGPRVLTSLSSRWLASSCRARDREVNLLGRGLPIVAAPLRLNHSKNGT